MNQRHPIMKLIASSVVFTFFVTSLGITPQTFAATPVALTPEVLAAQSGVLKIPAELGRVTDTVAGNPKAPAFIHIQAAHGNYQAEKNIEKLLAYIEKNSSVKLMLLEGAGSELRPELFRIFPENSDFNRKVTDKLMQEGYLTGPESFLINHNGATRNAQRATDEKKSLSAPEAYGVEDLEAYKKDRNAFLDVIKKEKAAEKFLGSLRASIDKRFSAKLNKDLLNLARQEEAFGSGTVSFESWIKTLGECSKKHLKIDLSDAYYQDQYPFLIRYFRLQAIGSKIDREKAMAEAEAFLKELEKRKLSPQIIESFKAAALSATSSVSATGYSPLRHAFDAAFDKLPKDFSMAKWPNWMLYAQHTILIQELESKGLHAETIRLKDKIQRVLAKTAAEKEFLVASRQLYLLRRLFSLELTRDEYEELNLAQRATVNAQRQDRKNDVALCALSVEPGSKALFASAMDFYSTAVIREQRMFANALNRMKGAKAQRAVIVTGGFHTDGLKQLAASKGCSYILITPRINEVSKRDHEIYLRSIVGSRDLETSQMSALLGIVDRAQRIAVTGAAATKVWARDVRDFVLGMINSENISDRPDLNLAFSHSVFGMPVSATAPVMARAEVREDIGAKEAEVAHVQGKLDQAFSVDWAPGVDALLAQKKQVQSELTKLRAAEAETPKAEPSRSEARSVLGKIPIAIVALLAELSARAAESPEAGASFYAGHPVASLFLSAGFMLGFFTAAYFIIWRIASPMSWFIWKLDSQDDSTKKNAQKKLLAMGEEVVPALLMELKGKSAERISGAAYVLGEKKDPRALEPLTQVMKGTKDYSYSVRMSAVTAVSKFPTAQVIMDLIQMLGDQDYRIRNHVALILIALKDPTILVPLIRVLDAKDPNARIMATQVIAQYHDPKSADALLKALLDENEDVRQNAIAGLRGWTIDMLGETKTTALVQLLIKSLQNKTYSVSARQSAASALGHLKDLRAVVPLVTELESSNAGLRQSAAAALRELQWKPKTVREAILFSVASQNWDEVERFGAEAVPSLLDFLKAEDFGQRSGAVGVLIKIADPRLDPLNRYFRWVLAGGYYGNTTYNTLTSDEIERIKENFSQGRITEADYEEVAEVNHEESQTGPYGEDYGMTTVVDSPAQLKVTIGGSKPIVVTSSKAFGTPSVAVMPAPTSKAQAMVKPYASDVPFWNFQTPAFEAVRDGMNVPSLRNTLTYLKQRSWLWNYFSSAEKTVNRRAVEKIGILRSRFPAIVSALYENKLISSATPLVSLGLAGSYLWSESPNDLDLIVIVAGNRDFERVSAAKLAATSPSIIPELETSFEVVGLETLKRAVKGEEFNNAKVIRRKVIMYSGAIPLTGVDLFKSQNIPLESYVIMRDDLMINAQKAAWDNIQGNETRIAAKKRWRQIEVDALAKWIEERSETLLTSIGISVSEELSRRDASHREEIAQLMRTQDVAHREAVDRLLLAKNTAHREEVARMVREKESAFRKEVDALVRSQEVSHAETMERLILERNQAHREEVFSFVLTQVPTYFTKLRDALNELRPLAVSADVAPQVAAAAIAEKKQKYALSDDSVRVLQAVFEEPLARSEVRLTDAQEKQFQKAMADLQPKWWDGWFNKQGKARKLKAIEELVSLKGPRVVSALGDDLLEDWIMNKKPELALEDETRNFIASMKSPQKEEAVSDREISRISPEEARALVGSAKLILDAGNDFVIVFHPGIYLKSMRIGSPATGNINDADVSFDYTDIRKAYWTVEPLKNIRSEARLTDEQEKQFKKAMADLEFKLLDVISDPNSVASRKAAAADVLGRLGDPRALPALQVASKSADKYVRFQAATAIRAIQESSSKTNQNQIDVHFDPNQIKNIGSEHMRSGHAWAIAPAYFIRNDAAALAAFRKIAGAVSLPSNLKLESGVLLNDAQNLDAFHLQGLLFRDLSQTNKNALVLVHFELTEKMVEAFKANFFSARGYGAGTEIIAIPMSATLLSSGNGTDVQIKLQSRSETRKELEGMELLAVASGIVSFMVPAGIFIKLMLSGYLDGMTAIPFFGTMAAGGVLGVGIWKTIDFITRKLKGERAPGGRLQELRRQEKWAELSNSILGPEDQTSPFMMSREFLFSAFAVTAGFLAFVLVPINWLGFVGTPLAIIAVVGTSVFSLYQRWRGRVLAPKPAVVDDRDQGAIQVSLTPEQEKEFQRAMKDLQPEWLSFFLGASPFASVQRASAARALGRLKDPRAVPMLTEVLKDETWFVRDAADNALKQIRAASSLQQEKPRSEARAVNESIKIVTEKRVLFTHPEFSDMKGNESVPDVQGAAREILERVRSGGTTADGKIWISTSSDGAPYWVKTVLAKTFGAFEDRHVHNFYFSGDKKAAMEDWLKRVQNDPSQVFTVTEEDRVLFTHPEFSDMKGNESIPDVQGAAREILERVHNGRAAADGKIWISTSSNGAPFWVKTVLAKAFGAFEDRHVHNFYFSGDKKAAMETWLSKLIADVGPNIRSEARVDEKVEEIAAMDGAQKWGDRLGHLKGILETLLPQVLGQTYRTGAGASKIDANSAAFAGPAQAPYLTLFLEVQGDGGLYESERWYLVKEPSATVVLRRSEPGAAAHPVLNFAWDKFVANSSFAATSVPFEQFARETFDLVGESSRPLIAALRFSAPRSESRGGSGYTLIHRGTSQDPLRIVLIMPRSPFQKEKPTRLPLGLMSLASCFRDKGFLQRVSDNFVGIKASPTPEAQVTIIDLQAEEENFDLSGRLKEINPDVVGVSAVTPFIQEAVRLAGTAQKATPKALRVLGGAHVSALEKSDEYGLKQLLSDSPFQMAVLGQGEQIFPEMVLRILNGLSFDTLAGVAFKPGSEENAPVIVHRRPVGKSQRISPEHFPLPSNSLDLVNLEGYARTINVEGSDLGVAGVIMTSLSCPFGCIFCASKVIFDRLFVFNAERVLADIQNYYSQGFRTFFIADDNFLLDKKRIEVIADKILEKFPEMHYSMMTRADSVDEEVAVHLKRSGCQVASIGVETGDPALLAKINKKMSIEVLERATQILQKNGLHVKYFLMVGLPGQDWASILKTAQMMVRLKPDSANVSVATPYPGSKLFRSGEIKILPGYGFEHFLHEPEPGRKAIDQVDVITSTDVMNSVEISEARELLMQLFQSVRKGDESATRSLMNRIESLANGSAVIPVISFDEARLTTPEVFVQKTDEGIDLTIVINGQRFKFFAKNAAELVAAIAKSNPANRLPIEIPARVISRDGDIQFGRGGVTPGKEDLRGRARWNYPTEIKGALEHQLRRSETREGEGKGTSRRRVPASANREDTAELVRVAKPRVSEKPVSERPISDLDAAAMRAWRNRGEKEFYAGIDKALKAGRSEARLSYLVTLPLRKIYLGEGEDRLFFVLKNAPQSPQVEKFFRHLESLLAGKSDRASRQKFATLEKIFSQSEKAIHLTFNIRTLELEVVGLDEPTKSWPEKTAVVFRPTSLASKLTGSGHSRVFLPQAYWELIGYSNEEKTYEMPLFTSVRSEARVGEVAEAGAIGTGALLSKIAALNAQKTEWARNLTVPEIQALTSEQVQALSSEQILAMSAEQKNALSLVLDKLLASQHFQQEPLPVEQPAIIDGKPQPEIAEKQYQDAMRELRPHWWWSLSAQDVYLTSLRRAAAARTLGNLKDGRAVPVLLEALKDAEWYTRAAAAEALGKLGFILAVPGLIDALNDRDLHVRYAVIRSLGQLKDSRAVPSLAKMADDDKENYWVRKAAREALELITVRLTPAQERQFRKALKDLQGRWWDWFIADQNAVAERKAAAATKLGELRDPRAVSALLIALTNTDWNVRDHAAIALGNLNDTRAVPGLIVATKDSEWYVRSHAIQSLGLLKDPRAIPALNEATQDKVWHVAQHAKDAIEAILASSKVPLKGKAGATGTTKLETGNAVLETSGKSRSESRVTEATLAVAEALRAHTPQSFRNVYAELLKFGHQPANMDKIIRAQDKDLFVAFLTYILNGTDAAIPVEDVGPLLYSAINTHLIGDDEKPFVDRVLQVLLSRHNTQEASEVAIVWTRLHGGAMAERRSEVRAEIDILQRKTQQKLGVLRVTSASPEISVVAVGETGRYSILNSANGKKADLQVLEHLGSVYAVVGNAVYQVYGNPVQGMELKLEDLNPVSNPALADLLGFEFNEQSLGKLEAPLPTDTVRPGESARLYFASASQQPLLRGSISLDPALREAYWHELRQLIGSGRQDQLDDSEIADLLNHREKLARFLHLAATLGIFADHEEYVFLKSGLLAKLITASKGNPDQKIIASIFNLVLTAHSGIDWNKWAKEGQNLRNAAAGQPAAATQAPRKATFFEKIDPARVPGGEADKYEIINARVLTAAEVSGNKDASVIELGNQIINEGMAAAFPFAGGSATTVRDAILKALKTKDDEIRRKATAAGVDPDRLIYTLNKMVHPALKVRTVNGKEEIISILEYRIQALLGQNPHTRIIAAVSDTPFGSESLSEVLKLLDGRLKAQRDSGQISVAIQRNGGILAPDGNLTRFNDGTLAVVAENHLWAFLAWLMDRDQVLDVLKKTSGIISMGNGDNGENKNNAEMVGKIAKARKEGKPLLTVAGGVKASAADLKGGIYVEVTYRHKETKETFKKIELRETGEFPTLVKERPDMPQYDAIDFSKEKAANSLAYQKAVAGNQFIENQMLDQNGQSTGALFNTAFYGFDAYLALSRIFDIPYDSQKGPEKLIAELSKIEAQDWVDRLNALAAGVPRTVAPKKKVVHEVDPKDEKSGWQTEQAGQNLIYVAALFDRPGLPSVQMDVIEIPRDEFLAYKGTFGGGIYDLELVQPTYAEAIRTGKTVLNLGGDRVQRIIPMTFDQIVSAIIDQAISDAVASRSEARQKGAAARARKAEPMYRAKLTPEQVAQKLLDKKAVDYWRSFGEAEFYDAIDQALENAKLKTGRSESRRKDVATAAGIGIGALLMRPKPVAALPKIKEAPAPSVTREHHRVLSEIIAKQRAAHHAIAGARRGVKDAIYDVDPATGWVKSVTIPAGFSNSGMYPVLRLSSGRSFVRLSNGVLLPVTNDRLLAAAAMVEAPAFPSVFAEAFTEAVIANRLSFSVAKTLAEAITPDMQSYEIDILVHQLTRPEVRSETRTPEETAKSKKKILVVDDYKNSRQAVMMVLAMEGYQGAQAKDGVEALKLLSAAKLAGAPFDVVMTDGEMPNMDGPQLIEAIRSSYAETKVIFMTGGMPGFPDAELAKLGDRYMPKPFGVPEILAALNDVLPRSEVRLSGKPETAFLQALKDLQPRFFWDYFMVAAGIQRRSLAARTLGRLKDQRAISALGAALTKDKAFEVRKFAAESLGEMNSPLVIPMLIAALQDKNWEVRATAVEVLGEKKELSAVPALIFTLKDSKAQVRKVTADALGEMKDPLSRAVAGLTVAVTDKEEGFVRAAAVEALGKMKAVSVASKMIEVLLNDTEWYVRAAAADTLGKMKDVLAVPALIASLDYPDWHVRASAAVALGKLRDARAVPGLLAALTNKINKDEWLVRSSIVEALGELRNPTAVSRLIEVLENDKNYHVRGSAAMALEKLKSAEAIPALRNAIEDDENYVSLAAAEAIESIEQAIGKGVGKAPTKVEELAQQPAPSNASREVPRSETRVQLVADDYVAANVLLNYLAERSVSIPKNPDVLLVLGNPDHQKNASAAARIYQKLKPKWVLVAGKGKGLRPEAVEFRDVLVANGVPQDKILLEDQSMNTGQNAQFGAVVLRREMAVRDPEMLNRPISIVVMQKPISERLSTRIMQKQFTWPQPVSFYSLAPRIPQVGEQTRANEFFVLVADALDQMGRFTAFAEKGFIDASAAQHPRDIIQAVQRLTPLLAAYESQPRSESRTYEMPMVPQVLVADTTSLAAKIRTAIRVAANTVSPLLSASPAYAAEIAPELFAGTSHYQATLTMPSEFAKRWPVLSQIIRHFVEGSKDRTIVDQRLGIPDVVSVLPLIAFARYNPKAEVVLALVTSDAGKLKAFRNELVAAGAGDVLDVNFKVDRFSTAAEFAGKFDEKYYNASVPLGRALALVMDHENRAVKAKLGSRRNLLSVIGNAVPLTQTASTLLAADKLLGSLEGIDPFIAIAALDKEGRLGELVANIASYIAAQAKVLASA